MKLSPPFLKLERADGARMLLVDAWQLDKIHRFACPGAAGDKMVPLKSPNEIKFRTF